MKPYRPLCASIYVLLLCASCAHTTANPSSTTKLPHGLPTTSIAGDLKSNLTIDQIVPAATLPAPTATTQSSEPAPVEALALYASARGASSRNDLAGAIGLLEHAIAIDPFSHDLYRALGDAHRLQSQRPTDPEMQAYEKALAIEPDDLALQALVGEQYISTGQQEKALLHLRQATHTTNYERDDLTAAAVDLLLGRLLQVQGYDRAALDSYGSLLKRLAHPSGALQADPQLGSLAEDPRLIDLAVGELLEKHQQWQQAYDAYKPIASSDPSDLDVQARMVRMLLMLNRQDEAIHKAAELVMQFDGSADALKLLNAVCGTGAPAMGRVESMYDRQPNDRAVAVALSYLLVQQGDSARATDVLRSRIASGDHDDRTVRRLFELYVSLARLDDATRLLVSELAAAPDEIGELSPLFSDLFRRLPPSRFSISSMQQLQVPATALPAKLFLVSRLASFSRRDTIERTSLEQAIARYPAFAPAYLALLDNDYARNDWSASDKQQAASALADTANRQGDARLALEIRAMSAYYAQQPRAADDFFSRALSTGKSSAQLQYNYASALIEQHQESRGEDLLNQITADQPRFADAWNVLYHLDVSHHAADEARHRLSAWLAADPACVEARLLQASDSSDEKAALNAVLKLYADHPQNPDIIAALVALYRRLGKLDEFTARLEDQRAHNPTDHNVVEWLVNIYDEQGRIAQAARVLDETRQACAKEPDLLYQLTPLYQLIGQNQASNDVLEQVIALDPSNAGPLNDLGFSWADAGLNLERAQRMIEQAVALEPDNENFIDSLGWVLYKRGDFAGAVVQLKKAIGPGIAADPTVIDHYGDALYRIHDTQLAQQMWQRSLGRLDAQPQRDDLQRLRLQLLQKLDAQKNHRAVNVAAVNVAAVAPEGIPSSRPSTLPTTAPTTAPSTTSSPSTTRSSN